MTTVDTSGTIHDARGRFAGRVASEPATSLAEDDWESFWDDTRKPTAPVDDSEWARFLRTQVHGDLADSRHAAAADLDENGRALYARSWRRGAGMTAQTTRALSDAGYTPDDLPLVSRFGMLEHGYPAVVMPVQNARALSGAYHVVHLRELGSSWLSEAMVKGEPDALARAVEAGGQEHEQVQRVIAAHDQVRGERVRAGFEAGLSLETIESGGDARP